MLMAGLLGVLAAELVARERVPPPRPKTVGALLHRSQDPLLETENAPGARQLVLYRDRSGREVRTVEHVIQPSGWRGPAFEREKPTGVFRIICVGDSHTFGHGVAEQESWPRALARALPERVDGRRVEVLNFGVGGYEGAQKVALIERRALAFDPDLILLQLYMNDSSVGHRNLAHGPRGSWLERLAQPGRGGWVRQLRARSELCNLILTRAFGEQCLARYMGANLGGFAPTNPKWLELQALIRGCHARLADAEVGLAIVLYPLLFERSGQLVSHPIGRAVGEFCDAAELPFIDLEPAFLGRTLEPLRIHPLDYHLTGEAHAIAAQATAVALHELGVLERFGH